jgi:hypothetical protein
VTSPYRSVPEGPSVGAALRMARLYWDRYPDTLDWSNVKGRTALHVAALRGNEELVGVRAYSCFSPSRQTSLTGISSPDAVRFGR